MVTPLEIRKQNGDVVETATLARILLDPVTRKLSAYRRSAIHRRCVFGRYLDLFSKPDGVRDDLAPFGAVEAVSVFDRLHMAVVVFWDEASVAVALQRQAETPSPGWFDAVPPLDAALEVCEFPEDDLIKAELYRRPTVPAAATLRKPLFWFRNSPDSPVTMAPPGRGDAGTTWFVPSRKARVDGPVVGADGHLWMDGVNLLFDEDSAVGYELDHVMVRVAALDHPPGDNDDTPTYVPLFSTAANPATCVPRAPAETAMLTLSHLREQHGDLVEAATIARDLLAPVEVRRLSGDPANLHRRCVLGRDLEWPCTPDRVRADLAPFGAIEAVAACRLACMAVIVFWDEASAAVALGRQAEACHGWFNAVPPLGAALPLCFFPPTDDIKVTFYPRPRAPATLAPPRPLRALFCFRDSPHEPLLRPPGGGYAGTTSFDPSADSLVYGPVVGPDGHLWMDGDNISYYERGNRIDPSWIRVTPLNSMGIYCGEPPMFVPLFSVPTSYSSFLFDQDS